MNYDEAIDWLFGTQLFGIKLGLENVTRLLTELGIPLSPDDKKIVHVAGTNGKGSVCAMADSIFREANVKCGLFTSPHLVTFGERIRVNGVMISESETARLLTDIREKVTGWDPHPTFFEITLALAMRHFYDEEVEVIVLETGMGGRLDATNALKATVSVITSISLDHTQWLGETIREIAAEKAGIIKPDTPVVVADVVPDARDVIGRRALTLGVPYIEAHPLPEDWPIGLPGAHQRENAALAVEAVCRVFDDGRKHLRITKVNIQDGLKNVSWPARFQTFEEKIVVDGAHNPDSITALVATWQARFGEEKVPVVFGAVESKDVTAALSILKPIAAHLTMVAVKSQRGLSTGNLIAHAHAAGFTDEEISEEEDLRNAIDALREGDRPSLICGSLFLAGQAISILEESTVFQVSEQ